MRQGKVQRRIIPDGLVRNGLQSQAALEVVFADQAERLFAGALVWAAPAGKVEELVVQSVVELGSDLVLLEPDFPLALEELDLDFAALGLVGVLEQHAVDRLEHLAHQRAGSGDGLVAPTQQQALDLLFLHGVLSVSRACPIVSRNGWRFPQTGNRPPCRVRNRDETVH
ncbi:MAG: hypothetical protein P8106_03290 [Gammaproteobacteria bacterium]